MRIVAPKVSLLYPRRWERQKTVFDSTLLFRELLFDQDMGSTRRCRQFRREAAAEATSIHPQEAGRSVRLRRLAPIPNWRLFMKSKNLHWVVRALVVVTLASASVVVAQERGPVHFSGLINDYSPGTVKGGPWEMHGQWSLELRPERGTADFSAVMTMSGYGTTAAGAVDPTQAGQNAHTHNIGLTNATVTWDMTGCPGYSPATKWGFQIG